MSILHVVFALAVLTAVGHSTLSEMKFLRPLRAETGGGSVFSNAVAKKLAFAMFHLASVTWVTIGISVLVLEPGQAGYRATLHLFAAVFVISGLGNFWAVGKPHPGGVMLLGAGFLVLVSLYS